jgi:hypothetical protein
MAHELNRQGLITLESMVFAVGLAMVKFYRPQVGLLSVQASFRRQPLDVGEMFIVAAIGFAGVALLRSLLLDPIEEWDSLAWHLPIMTTWYQSGFLSIFVDYAIYARYPFSWEVLCTLFLFPFGEDYLVTFPNLIAWIIFGLTVYLLSGAMGVNRLSSMIAATLVLLLPIMKVQVNSLHVDLPMGAFFLSSLYFMLSYLKSRSSIDLFLFIALIGMVCGIKTSGLVYGLALLCPIALIAGKLIAGNGLSNSIVRKPGLALVAGVGTALLVGAFWYIRNFIEVGNPLGFVTVRVGEVTLFHGIIDTEFIRRSTLAFLFDVRNITHWKILGGQILRQLGPPFLILVLAGLLLPVAVLKQEKKISRFYYVGLVGLLLATCYLYWHTPYSGADGTNSLIAPYVGTQFRYGFPFIGLVAVAAAVGVGTFRHAEKYWIGAVLVNAAIFVGYGIVLYAFIATILIIPIVARFGAVGTIMPRVFVQNRSMVSVGVILLLGMSVWLGYVTRERRAEQREVVYGGIQKYIREHVGLDETIAYVAVTKPYLLYGRELNRKVTYVSASGLTHDEWVAKLRARAVAVVAVGPLLNGESGGKALLWLQSEERVFERIFGHDAMRETVLYRVRR